MDSLQLAKEINNIRDAVDKSCFGPMFQYPDSNDISKRNLNQLAYGVFVIMLQAMAKDILKK